MNKKTGKKKIESVWDYPRPPRLEKTGRRIKIVHQGEVIASATRALRILETSHPPTYYLPREDIKEELLVANRNRTFCEWKGEASYFDLVMGDTVVSDVAWTYTEPNPDYQDLVGHLAFYAQKLEACYVDDQKVDAQAGSFYGGWITADITGPFKGGTGTTGW